MSDIQLDPINVTGIDAPILFPINFYDVVTQVPNYVIGEPIFTQNQSNNIKDIYQYVLKNASTILTNGRVVLSINVMLSPEQNGQLFENIIKLLVLASLNNSDNMKNLISIYKKGTITFELHLNFGKNHHYAGDFAYDIKGTTDIVLEEIFNESLKKIFDKYKNKVPKKLKKHDIENSLKFIKITFAYINNQVLSSSNTIKTDIRNIETFRDKAYKPTTNDKWTIGYGSTYYIDDKGKVTTVKEGDKITKTAALTLFNKIVDKECDTPIKNVLTVPVNQNQLDALVSLVYNIGQTNFNNSTLLKKLNEENYKEAAKQFLVWNKQGSTVLDGLTKRRKKEKILFETPIPK